MFRLFFLFLTTLVLISCQPQKTTASKKMGTAKEFLDHANKTLKEQTHASSVASWVHANFITADTTMMSSEYNARFTEMMTQIALDSKKYQGKTDDEKRMLDLLVRVLTVPAPNNPEKNKELAQLRSELESLYGSGKYCPKEGECRTLGELSKTIAKSRNHKELLEAWEGWRTVSPAMKDKFQKSVEIGNEGARELGFKNMADLWRSNYDMKPEAFEKELDRLWTEMKPFYDQLHCFVRGKLNKKYGDDVVPLDKEIPAHLFGNMWAQAWDNIVDVVGIGENKSMDITQLITKAKYDPTKMVKTAENFFVSLGMPKLPESFYERSLFKKPKDREVVCHASAWHIDMEDDVRIKMCIDIDEESFRTIHHELGHIYYYEAYKSLPPIYQSSANDGFHEAMGDTIELSITAKYLKKIGLLKDSGTSNGAVHETL
ncbi:MAG: M2 family metallopeptidase, partial [Pseudomonadota bacterium]